MNRRAIYTAVTLLASVGLFALLVLRRHSFDLELVDEYTGTADEPADQPD